MTTETEEKKIVPDMTEMVSVEGDPICKVLRQFYLKIVNGPHRLTEAGTLVRLSKQTGLELFFTNRISLIELEGEKQYKCSRKFQYTNAQGEYELIEVGTVLLLNEKEAEKYIKEGAVLPAFDTSLWGVFREDN